MHYEGDTARGGVTEIRCDSTVYRKKNTDDNLDFSPLSGKRVQRTPGCLNSQVYTKTKL